MKQNTKQINYEIRAFSRYRALLISKYYITIFLLLFLLNLPLDQHSAIYILIILNIFPFVFTQVFKEHIKAEKPFLLIMLKNKYRYSRIHYLSNSFSFLLALVLLCFWQLSLNHQTTDSIYNMFFPIFLLISSIILRIFCYIFYQIKIRHDLSTNQI